MRLSKHQILIRPVLTEKTTHAIEARNSYVFEIARDANKIQVRRAVEDLFDVKVLKVNVLNRRGKLKRVGRSVGYGRTTRRAIVTIKRGEKIDVY